MASALNTAEQKPYQKIADQLRAYIAQGDFSAGSRLPPERDLTQLLGVSRPSLREALVALEIEGAVEIKMGSGVYVRKPPTAAQPTRLPLGESPSELMQARALIEGESVVLACLHGKKSDHRYLQACIDAMRASIAQGQAPLEDDRKFHQRLAKMSGNGALVRIITTLFDERHTPLSAHLSKHAENRLTWEAAVSEHEAILAAVARQDVLGAQTAMRLHLSRSENRWLRVLEPED